MGYKSFLSLSVLILATLSLACSDSSNSTAGNSTTTLTNKQAKTVASGLANAGNSIFDNLSFKVSQKIINFAVENVDINETCDQGNGTVTITGSTDFTTANDSLSGSYDLEVELEDCEISNDDNSVVIAVTGSLTQTGVLEIFQDEDGSGSGTIEGSVDIAGEGVDEGTCGVDYTGDSVVSPSDSTITTTYSGSICGTDLDYSEVEDL